MTQQGPVNAVAFSPDGRWVAMGSDDQTARVFEARTGKEVSHLAQQGTVRAVAFSPDGRWVATGSDDQTARVFEASTGKEVSRLTQRDKVRAVAFSPDGRWVPVVWCIWKLAAGNGSVEQTADKVAMAPSMAAYSSAPDAGGLQMFRTKEIVKTSGRGRTDWPEQVGTVTKVTAGSVFVQWHDCAVEDEMDCDERVSTGTFNDIVPVEFAVLTPPEEKPPTIHFGGRHTK